MKFLHLFSPHRLGPMNLKNSIVMAPMTRCRSHQPGNIPTDLMAEYYGQRASAGLIITEATQVSPKGQGYSFTPGIHEPEQVAGWRKVTKTVHDRGGKIFLQLWHVGRLSHESFHEDGTPLAPSALAADARVRIVDAKGIASMKQCPLPRAMTQEDIDLVIGQFRVGALNAIDAGFDGVEIHGANGYLIDQFLRRTSNVRTDSYGGPMENRIKFALEVAEAVKAEIGAERTGIRFSPFIKERGMNDPEAVDAILLAAHYLSSMKLAYIHLSETDWDEASVIPESYGRQLRQTFSGSIIAAGNYTPEKAESAIASGLVDMVAFGRPFIANPDFPARILNGWPLATFDSTQLYGGSEAGYTTYPAYDPAHSD